MKVYLIGVGMGNPATLTGQALEAIGDSPVLVGAPRLLEPWTEGHDCVPLIAAADIAAYVDKAPRGPVGVLLSGDTGFYSGAKGLWPLLGNHEVITIPGISSLSYFCARLQTTWQDARLVSAHGRSHNAVGEIQRSAKVFALTGKVQRGGLVEVPMGNSLKDVIFDIAGGIKDGRQYKAVQMGGPSGGCIPASLIDTPIDYESLSAIGSMMGSGGLIVMDEDNCMVDIAKFYLEFIVDESCGKCSPCRIGTKRLLDLLTKITEGNGEPEDLDTIEELCHHIKQSALCGLGQTAPNPVLSTLTHFREEFEAHIYEKRCPAGVCKALIQYIVDPTKCKGCTRCAQGCPTGAISGAVRAPHIINQSKCIKCGACMDHCRFDAIYKQ